jgi:uncharacterized protein YjiS (DUF1127 family)
MPCGSQTCTSLNPVSIASYERAAPALSPWPWRALRRVGVMIERHRQRRILVELDDGLLSDIGLTRDQVAREARKPFWR